MTFDLNAFVQIGGGSRFRKSTPQGSAPTSGAGFSVWSYFHATDNLAAVKATGYFNEARNLIGDGDVVMFSENGAAVQIITFNAVPASGDVTIHTADINSA